jgi:hypothetical protein
MSVSPGWTGRPAPGAAISSGSAPKRTRRTLAFRGPAAARSASAIRVSSASWASVMLDDPSTSTTAETAVSSRRRAGPASTSAARATNRRRTSVCATRRPGDASVTERTAAITR